VAGLAVPNGAHEHNATLRIATPLAVRIAVAGGPHWQSICSLNICPSKRLGCFLCKRRLAGVVAWKRSGLEENEIANSRD